MTVGELKKKLADVPDNTVVMLTTAWYTTTVPGYEKIVRPPRKAKKRLVKPYNSNFVAQSRPKKDQEATIAFVIED
ncbi:MAG TPA: hypothetical protein DDY18_01545 [Flavobacterium sp.]|jgi:hypothetical protein|nr:hypothetical protein [Flavobacterium sp.]